MPLLTLLLSLLLSTSSVASSPEMKMKQAQCEQILCDDLTGEEHYRCRRQQKNCHKRVFSEQLLLWKKEGVTRRVQQDVVRSLEQAKRENERLIARLQSEIQLMREEIQEIEQQMGEVRDLRSR